MGIIKVHPTTTDLIEFPLPTALAQPELERIIEYDSWIYMDNGDGEPRPFCLSGITPNLYCDRAWGWAVFRPPIPLLGGRYIIRDIRTRLEKAPYQRIETSVDADNWHDIKLAEALGMELEGLMRKYGPNGEDHLLYAYIKCQQ